MSEKAARQIQDFVFAVPRDAEGQLVTETLDEKAYRVRMKFLCGGTPEIGDWRMFKMTPEDRRLTVANAKARISESFLPLLFEHGFGPKGGEAGGRAFDVVEKGEDVYVDFELDAETWAGAVKPGLKWMGRSAGLRGWIDEDGYIRPTDLFEGSLTNCPAMKGLGSVEPMHTFASRFRAEERLAEKDPKFAIGDRVEALVNHQPGMSGMVGKISIARVAPYYAVTFDEPMDGMSSPHKWLAEDELKSEGADLSKTKSPAAHVALASDSPDSPAVASKPKEKPMKPEALALLGLAAGASPEDIEKAIEQKFAKEKSDASATAAAQPAAVTLSDINRLIAEQIGTVVAQAGAVATQKAEEFNAKTRRENEIAHVLSTARGLGSICKADEEGLTKFLKADFEAAKAYIESLPKGKHHAPGAFERLTGSNTMTASAEGASVTSIDPGKLFTACIREGRRLSPAYANNGAATARAFNVFVANPEALSAAVK